MSTNLPEHENAEVPKEALMTKTKTFIKNTMGSTYLLTTRFHFGLESNEIYHVI